MLKMSGRQIFLVHAIVLLAFDLISAQTDVKAVGVLKPGEKMHFSIGNDVDLQLKSRDEAKQITEPRAIDASKADVTAFEPYVKWMMLETEENKWDFSYYDMLVDIYKEQGIKWVPFLIAGPAYSTPMWFKESDQSVFARCLEHDTETRTQSIWNPAMP